MTYIRHESTNERCRNTVREGSSFIANTVRQRDKKPDTAGLDDTAIPHIKLKCLKSKLPKKTRLKTSSRTQYPYPPPPPH